MTAARATAARLRVAFAAGLLAIGFAGSWPIAPARSQPGAPARQRLTLRLEPPSSEIAFRAYGVGFLPIDGRFGRFSGTLRLDPADPSVCAIEVEADVASLAMPDRAMTEDALGPDLLDAPRFPRFAYRGECRADSARGAPTLYGDLTLHGVTRPLAFQVSREAGRFVATAMMRRAEWGMGARPLLAGPEVRIRFTTVLPTPFQTPGRPG